VVRRGVMGEMGVGWGRGKGWRCWGMGEWVGCGDGLEICIY